MQRKRKLGDASSFRERVLAIVRNIKEGDALTYGEVARLAGNSKAARGVGAIMKTNFDPTIPCHRVVSKCGIGGYNRGVANKRALLHAEGFLR
jgi:O-6-methylguanine DNA methyltransferase